MTLQLLKKAATPLGGDCLLCGAAAGAAAVCDACSEALPRLGAACPLCALPMPHAEPCGRCLRRPTPVDAAVAAFEYRFPIDRVVRRFKFAGDLAAGDWLARELAAAPRPRPAPALVVVPPSDPAHLRRRGFNQALEVAKGVSAVLGLALDPGAVVRVRAAPSQAGLGAGARRRNLRGAFACRRALAGAAVAIVDDVMTTGATVEAIARALKDAGAGRVEAWVVARTPDPRS